MKKTLLCILILGFWFQSYAQVGTDELGRHIIVVGSADITVQPDEIELEIQLEEYNRAVIGKVNLSAIESKFIRILKENNIDDSKVIFADSRYYWYYWWSSRRSDYKRKAFIVKLNIETDFLSLVKDLDFEGVKSLKISNTSNSELQNLRREVKVTALKAAKEKASYLLESIDEQVGRVLSIEEIPENNNNYYWRGRPNALSNTTITRNSTSSEMESVSSIKLRCQIKAKFEIK